MSRPRENPLNWKNIPFDPARLPLATLLKLAAAFCAIVGLYDVAAITSMLAGGPDLGPPKWVLFPDFLVFNAASRAFLEGHLVTIYDFDAFHRFENAIYADRFPSYVGFRPYLYPPQWVLLTLPLALVPVGVAYGLFMGGTAALATALAGLRDKWGWLAVMTSPGAFWTMVSGQNSFLSVGLFYGGLRLVERHPIGAGVALGALSYKPQLWAMVPVALLVARQWRALASTLATAALLALFSFLIFGVDVWRAFFELARFASSPHFTETMFGVVGDYMTTVLAGARIAGLPTVPAQILHGIVAVAAVAAVVHACRRAPWNDVQIAVIAAASLLISPSLINYDMLLVMPAAVALFRQRARSGFLPGEPFFYAALWLAPNIGMRFNQHHLPLSAVLIVLFLGLAWLTARPPAKSALVRA